MEKISQEVALLAAETVVKLAETSILPKSLLTDPWLACEQQLVARFYWIQRKDTAKNGEAWEAGNILQNYFLQEGLLFKK